MSDPKEHVIWHQSGVNPDGEPFVQLLQDMTVIGQMSPQQAREHGQAIIEAAEAAEQDAFLWDWVINKTGSGKVQAAGLIADFRKYREERTGKKGGPSNPRDWVMPPDDKRSPDPDWFTKK